MKMNMYWHMKNITEINHIVIIYFSETHNKFLENFIFLSKKIVLKSYLFLDIYVHT